jgi:hypothetical protein
MRPLPDRLQHLRAIVVILAGVSYVKGLLKAAERISKVPKKYAIRFFVKLQ